MNTILWTKQMAFTLVELLVTLAVFTLLVLITLPSFSTMIMNQRMTAATDSLVNALNYARNIALQEAVDVRVCPFGSANASTCGSDWTSGWIIVRMPALGANTLLQSEQYPNSGPSITATANTIIFSPNGLASTLSNFTLCDQRGSQFAQSLQVLVTGFVQKGAAPGQAVWNNGSLVCP